MKISSEVAKDTLQSIITLYVHIRVYSFAKDLVQKFKLKNVSQKKPLRKEMKNSCTGSGMFNF